MEHTNTSYLEQPYATQSYGQHSLLATINVLRAVIAAAAQVRIPRDQQFIAEADYPFTAHCGKGRRCIRQSGTYPSFDRLLYRGYYSGGMRNDFGGFRCGGCYLPGEIYAHEILARV